MLESPELSGLLYKRRGGFGKIMPNAWQYRFFTLSRDGILQYFDTEIPDTDSLDSRARGRLDLRSLNYDVSLEPIEGAPTQHPIQIVIPNEETWKMCAYGKDDQMRWVKALEKYQNEKLAKVSSPITSYVSDDENDRIRKSRSVKDKNDTINPPVVDRGLSDNVPSAQISSLPVVANSNLSVSKASQPDTSSGSVEPVVTRGRRGSVKKRLKLSGGKNLIDAETGELFVVAALVNVSFYGALNTEIFAFKLLYCFIINFVIVHSLKLRSERRKKIGKPELVSKPVVEVAQKPRCEPIEEVVAVVGSDSHQVTIEETPVTLITSNQKPVPGQTYIKAAGDPRRAPPHTWSEVDHRLFNVRIGPNYDRYKKKAPSGAPIYEPFAVDVFCTKSRVDHCARKFQLPDTSDIQTFNDFVPPIFIIQIQIPSEPPPSFFSTTEDGPGWAVVMYFRITANACEQLKNIESASPAVKLFANWCAKAETDPLWRGRFKVINSCTNLSEIGVPSAIEAYNAKPVLIRRTGSIFRGSNYVEMNIHVHKFANLAKQSIYLLSSRCAQLYMQIGFVIEGRDDSELPETLFACVAINRPQEDQAEFIFED